MLRRAVIAILVMLTSSACSPPHIPFPGGGPAQPVPIPSDAADQPTPVVDWTDPSFVKAAHPAFRRAFTDPLYYDEAEEFSPFGSDEGSDTLATWSESKARLGQCATVRWMIEQDDVAGALDDPAGNEPDVDGFVIGAGFAMIYLTGRIDAEGKKLTLDALRRTYSFYADHNPREQPVMIRDLEAFPTTDC